MSILSKIFGKKEKNKRKEYLYPGPRKGGVNRGPSTPKPKVQQVGQGLSKKEIKISLDKEDRKLIKELIKKYES